MATVGQVLTSPEAGWKRIPFNTLSDERFYFLGAWSSSASYVESAGYDATFYFTLSGTAFRLIAYYQYNMSNNIEVFIDGVSQDSFSCYISSSSASVLVYEKTGLSSGTHLVKIVKHTANAITLQAIDILSADSLLPCDPFANITKTKVSALKNIGDRIAFEYTAPTAGQVGSFANLGSATKAEIPAASSATPDGKAYFIFAGYDTQGRMKLVCDRNIQHSISWDTINAAGLVNGVEVDIGGTKGIMRLMSGGVSSADTDNEWDKIIVGSTLGGTITAGDNSVWNWQNQFSLLSTTYNAAGNRASNGYNSASYKGYVSSSNVAATNGFRPVLLFELGQVTIQRSQAIVPLRAYNDTSPIQFAVRTGVANASGQELTVKYVISVNGQQLSESSFLPLGDYLIGLSYADLQNGVNMVSVRAVNSIVAENTLSLTVYKEEPYRRQVIRSLHSYEGGYDTDLIVNEGIKYPAGVTNGYLKTTNKTRIDLKGYAGIDKITVKGYEGKYALSFDKGVTWKAYGVTGYGNISSINVALNSNGKAFASSYQVGLSALPELAFGKSLYWTNDQTSVLPQQLGMRFTQARRIAAYSVTPYSESLVNDDIISHYPKSWTFEGSNNNVDWDVLDTQTAIAFTQPTLTFPLTSPRKYTSYRINITARNGSNSFVAIDELGMYESEPLYGWVDVTPSTIQELGMSLAALNALTSLLYKDIFQQTSLDIYAAMHPTVQQVLGVPTSVTDNTNWATYPGSSAWDQNNKTYWCTNWAPSLGNPAYATATFASELVVGGYTIKADKTGTGLGYPGPRSWRLEGWDGTQWVSLDEHIGDLSLVNDGLDHTYTFAVFKSTKFRIAFLQANPIGYVGSINSIKLLSPTQSALESITVDLPANNPPAILNPLIDLTTVHKGIVTLTADLSDAELSPISYQILLNGVALIPYTSYSSSINFPIDSSLMVQGSNVVKLVCNDERGDTTSWEQYVTVTNSPPAKIVSAVTEAVVTATLDDVDGDKVSYQVLVNGVLQQDWTEFQSAPYNMKFIVDRKDIVFGAPCTIKINIKDDMGATGSFEETFIGSYYGLLFTDENGDYYSTDMNVVLKRLQMGAWVVGQNSLPQVVRILNTTGVTLQNIRVSVDPTSIPPNTYVKLSHDLPTFDDADIIDITRTVNNGDYVTFQVRIASDLSATGGGVFKIKAVGTPA